MLNDVFFFLSFVVKETGQVCCWRSYADCESYKMKS